MILVDDGRVEGRMGRKGEQAAAGGHSTAGRKKARNRSTYKAVILLAKPLWRRALAALCEAPRRALSRADGGCGLPSPRPIAATKKPVAVPRSRAARADVPVIDGWLPRQRSKAAEPGHPPGLVRSDLMAVRLNRRGRLSSPVARSRSDLMSSRQCRASTGDTGLAFSFATPALVGAVHTRSRPPSFAVEELARNVHGEQGHHFARWQQGSVQKHGPESKRGFLRAVTAWP